MYVVKGKADRLAKYNIAAAHLWQNGISSCEKGGDTAKSGVFRNCVQHIVAKELIPWI